MVAYLLCALLAVEPTNLAHPLDHDAEGAAEEPADGAGVSPVELVPRIELRQSFQKLDNGANVQDTTAEIDIQFVKRILLRYQVPHRSVTTADGRVSGIGDTQLGAIVILLSDAQRLFGLVGGAVLDTATAPQLGQGKQQVYFGVGAAYKPKPWLLSYAIFQEQLSVGGNDMREDINQAAADVGAILFGRQFNWLKLDLVPTIDFPGATKGRLFGTFEVGSLLIGRVGLFVRAGTQLVGPAQLDYSLAMGARYLFRLGEAKLR
jgi:hypothetical protein